MIHDQHASNIEISGIQDQHTLIIVETFGVQDNTQLGIIVETSWILDPQAKSFFHPQDPTGSKTPTSMLQDSSGIMWE
jgi:hypothetical protein